MTDDYTNFINDLKRDVSIIDLVQRLRLKVININSEHPKTLCPFHPDTNPSMILYPKENSYHCFVCTAHGDIFSITKKVMGFSDFKESLKWIAQEYNKTLPEFKSIDKVLEIDKDGFEIAFETYKKQEKSERELRRIYSIERGFSEEFFENVEIFAVNKNKLFRKYKNSTLYKEKLLEKNLLKNLIKSTQEQKEMQYPDIIDIKDTFYTDKLVFTLRNAANNIIGFAGRSVNDSDRPKYLYTKGLPKSNLIYRLNILRQKISKNEESIYHIYLTEGLFDALRLEEKGFNAIAVLGSSLTVEQAKVLIDFFNELKAYGKIIHIHLFFDSDQAGINGTYKTLEILWNNSQTRNLYIDVIIPPYEGLDPDSFLKGYTEDNKLLLEKNIITVFDFLFAYYMKTEIKQFKSVDIYNLFSNRVSSEKYYILSMIAKMLPKPYWEFIIPIYNYDIKKDETLYFIFKSFISVLQDKKNIINKSSNDSVKILYHAFSIARNSYLREEIPLDESTWERMDKCFDLFYEYFVKEFYYGDNINKPIMGINIPKGGNDYRLKVLFCHEKLLMQQYILNELLVNRNTLDYSELIPAVRYSSDREKNKESIITTGFNLSQVFKDNDIKAVSFAYQIHSAVIDGLIAGKNGMFKNYYLCWQDFINFIHSGINQINNDKIYKVRLDIHKFYDTLPIRAVQNILHNCLKEALRISGSENYFNLLYSKEQPEERATKICDWICKEIFNYEYLNPKTGNKEKYIMKDRGIPQGPNLSAYLANISLFPLDAAVQKYVVSVNADSDDKERKTTHLRYARYVDDMIIIADDPKHILKVKNIIENELEKIGLELSIKTEPAVAAKKEDAIEWLIDERGGLGVSQGSDIPECDYVELINESYDYEILNRRDALTILTNSIYTFKSNTQDEKLEKDALKVLFKTDDAKYRDIIRIAELMWNHIMNFMGESEQSELCLNDYFMLWEYLNDPNEYRASLFLREDVKKMSVLDGIENILKRDINKEYSLNQDEKQKMCEKLQNISKLVLSQDFINYYIRDEIPENTYAIKCKMLNLICLAVRNFENDSTLISNSMHWILKEFNDEITKNRDYELSFLLDFQYTIKKEIQGLSLNVLPKDDGNILALIHYVINRIEILDSDKLTNILPTQWIDYSPNDNTPEFVLYYCMNMWIRNEDELNSNKSLTNNNNYLEKIALYSIVNILNKDIIADVLSKNNILKKYLFSEEIKNIIPVPPGVNYNGIFGISIFAEYNPHYLERVDFNSNSIDENIVWNKDDKKNDGLTHFKSTLLGKWESLNEYFLNKEIKQREFKDIVQIFKNILKYIKENSKDNEKLVLSKYNIFVDEKYNIKILSYRINADKLISPVYISCGINGIVANEIPKEGECYWAVGT